MSRTWLVAVAVLWPLNGAACYALGFAEGMLWQLGRAQFRSAQRSERRVYGHRRRASPAVFDRLLPGKTRSAGRTQTDSDSRHAPESRRAGENQLHRRLDNRTLIQNSKFKIKRKERPGSPVN